MLKITEKLRPFSHQPGTSCLIPGSSWILSAFPAMLSVQGIDYPVCLTGPVREFTVQMDLERDCVWIWGIAKEGHFRFKLFADEIGLALLVDRCSESGLGIGTHKLKRKEKILLLSGGNVRLPKKIERLSLGNWKAQDWDLVRRRNEPREWVPILFALSQKVPLTGDANGGPLDLLDKLAEFFPAAFTGILVPHLIDPLHQGLFPDDGHGDPLALLTLSYKKIRSALIQDEQILPALPSDWDCGRVLGLQTQYGPLDLEWTKGAIRQMILHAEKSAKASFTFSKPVKSFRFNGVRTEQGQSLAIEARKKYTFDRFQK
jgi:hypothetical protein